MQSILLSLAVVAYVCAMGLALVYLVQRHEMAHRLAFIATLAGFCLHTVALIVLAVQIGRPPIRALTDGVSVAVWVIVLLSLLVEHWSGLKVLAAFVMPIVVLFSLKAGAMRSSMLGRTLTGPWVYVHIALALIGVAAFVLNFAGALMYLLQERQLKGKRPGAFYYRLPPLDTLDRLTYRTLALGFPFLTLGLILGAVWAKTAWGSPFAFDPLALLSFGAWIIYAGTLAGRAAGGWHGRRAAYFAIFGFAALVLTLGAGLFLPGKHGA
jgi:cytochrome c-type biogenesis protein CcsB